MPEIPEYFNRALLNLCGRNFFGEPKLKVVWGADARDWRGQFKYINPNTNKPFQCWILTRYADAKFFGSFEEWEKDKMFYDDIHGAWIDRKGPYPHRGDYVMVCPLSNDGEYLCLDESVIAAIARKVRADEEFAAMKEQERGEMIAAQHRQEEADKQEALDSEDAKRREYYNTNWERINRGATRGYSITPR